MGKMKISEILINYLKEPAGIENVPQFSWIIESRNNAVYQKNYQLQISLNQDFSLLLYDSAIVESNQSVRIVPDDFYVVSAKKYFVRVRITAKNGEISDWSVTNFITGICCKKLWQADFVTAETKVDKNNSKGTYVRGNFNIQKDVAEAYSFTTAHGLYKAYMNGVRIGDDELSPGWTSYNKRLLYQTNEITSYIHLGENTFAASLGAGWYKGKMGFLDERNNYGQMTAFMGQILVRYTDGSEEWFYTNDSYYGIDSPVLFSEIYDGEVYDSNYQIDNWNHRGCDVSDWRKVNVISNDPTVLNAQTGSRVKIAEMIRVKKMFTTLKGEIVLDFGQNLTGWVKFKCKGMKDDIVEFTCFEVLDSSGNVYLDNLRLAKQRIFYKFGKNGWITYQPNFTFQGFRYIHIKQFPSEIDPDNFVACVVHSEMEETGSFESSNSALNQLHHNILWSMKGNFLDIPTDCPQRNERCGWTGDAQIFSRTACYLMNAYTFFSKWIKDVAADQTIEGGVPHVVPDIITGKEKDDWLLSQGTHSAAGWADVAVIVPWTLYLMYGDRVILEEQYDSMKAWVDFMRKHSVNNIWNYKLQFGDWVALDAKEGSYFGATPNDLSCTAYYAYSIKIFYKISNILGKDRDAREYKELYQNIVSTFQKEFFNENGEMNVQTQTAHILALHFELVPKRYKEKVAADLVRLLEKEDGHLVTGFMGTPYFCSALSDNGYVKEAFDLLMKNDFPSWLYQVKMGATTIWEHWDGIKPDGTMWSPSMNSFNHYAYGAVGEWLYCVIAGIEMDEKAPGFKHTIIQPHIGGGLSEVQASYKSIYGKIKVHWKLNKITKNVDLRLSIPHNTTASLILKDVTAIKTFEKLDCCEQKGCLKFELLSGIHELSYRAESDDS